MPKLNKWVGYTILTQLYLNAERMTVSAHWPGTQPMQQMLSSIRWSIRFGNSGVFCSILNPANEGSRENIICGSLERILQEFLVENVCITSSAAWIHF